MVNNMQQIHLKVLQKDLLKKLAEKTDDLIDNNIADKITKVSRSSSQNNWGTITNETKNIGLVKY